MFGEVSVKPLFFYTKCHVKENVTFCILKHTIMIMYEEVRNKALRCMLLGTYSYFPLSACRYYYEVRAHVQTNDYSKPEISS